MVKVRTCFKDAIIDGENTLYLILKQELNNSNDSNRSDSTSSGSYRNGSNENNSKAPPSTRKILKLS